MRREDVVGGVADEMGERLGPRLIRDPEVLVAAPVQHDRAVARTPLARTRPTATSCRSPARPTPTRPVVHPPRQPATTCSGSRARCARPTNTAAEAPPTPAGERDRERGVRSRPPGRAGRAHRGPGRRRARRPRAGAAPFPARGPAPRRAPREPVGRRGPRRPDGPSGTAPASTRPTDRSRIGCRVTNDSSSPTSAPWWPSIRSASIRSSTVERRSSSSRSASAAGPPAAATVGQRVPPPQPKRLAQLRRRPRRRHRRRAHPLPAVAWRSKSASRRSTRMRNAQHVAGRTRRQDLPPARRPRVPCAPAPRTPASSSRP